MKAVVEDVFSLGYDTFVTVRNGGGCAMIDCNGVRTNVEVNQDFIFLKRDES